MNHTNLKNIFWGVVAVGILAVAYAAVGYVNAYGTSIQPSSFRSFSVSGDGKATGIPDVAEFSFQVITQGGTDIAASQSKNTDAVNKAIAYVKSKGVADKDIKTQYYNVEPRYQTYNCSPRPMIVNGGGATSASSDVSTPDVQACPPASIVGYTVNQSVDVKVRDFTKIGDIMSGIVSNGANQVGSLSFTIDDPTVVQNEARADAIAKAKAEAEAIARAGGFRLGRLLSVQQGGGGYYPQSYDAMGAGISAMKSAAAPTPTIQAGSQDVNVTMTLQYEIE